LQLVLGDGVIRGNVREALRITAVHRGLPSILVGVCTKNLNPNAVVMKSAKQCM
jgi:hypothetical protein